MFVLRNRKQTHNCSQKRNSYTILFMYVVKMGGNDVFLLMWVFGISFGVAGDSSSVILISVCTSFFEYVLPTWSKLCKEECKFYFSIVLTRIWNVSFLSIWIYIKWYIRLGWFISSWRTSSSVSLRQYCILFGVVIDSTYSTVYGWQLNIPRLGLSLQIEFWHWLSLVV